MDKAFINKTSKTEQIQESKNMVMQTLEVNSKKIITESSAVRHLGDFQDKTQVFPLDKSDFIRTRLTHSMEVSSLAKSLGQNIGESILVHKKDSSFTVQMKEDICNILQCAGLIHDIGNPPFGHYGEAAIREWFERNLPLLTYHGTSLEELLEPQMREDFYHFEGNAQALRLVSKLHFLVDENGMNLTYALLNTIIKYPVASTKIHPESEISERRRWAIIMQTGNCSRILYQRRVRKSQTSTYLFILEAADDIAYKTADIEDAFVKRFLTYHSLRDELRKLQNRGEKVCRPRRERSELVLPGR